MLVFLFSSLQIVGDELVEPDLLEAALQEIEEDESEKRHKRKLAEKDRRQIQEIEPSDTSSSAEQNFDFGDVVVTISERELEDVPHVYLQKPDNQSPSLTVKKPPKRQTSSIKPQEQTQREPSSK
ncbi:MAG: hypothetical protein OXB86_07080 [Bdellovibrionales bacterium]|nr:hypothetical protein [Bdellovibrionales bacterium]